MKKFISLFLAVVMCLSICACGAQPKQEPAQPETRQFTDDCGRTVTLPAKIEKVAVSGPLSQIYILPLCPELMVGYASEFSENMGKYIKQEYLSLPTLGQLYGGKGTMDLEALLAAAPDVVIDIGEQKGNIKEELDGLTEQCGISFVHIDATVETAPAAYRRLGELVGKQEKAEELAVYLEGVLNRTKDIMSKVDADGARKTLVYCLGDKGQNVLAEKSFHAETLNLVAKNVAEIEDVVSSGAGNEVDMEQLMLWNPEYIVFAPDSVYSQVGSDQAWQQLDAVKNGNYVQTPTGPYGWLQSPPSVQRYLGLMWLTSLLYPEYCDYDIKTEIQQYYKLFYDYDLSDAEYAELTANAF